MPVTGLDGQTVTPTEAVLAAVESVGTAASSTFLQLGAIGALALFLLWFSYKVYGREVKRADTAEADLKALQEKVISLYVPAVTEASRVVGEFLIESRRDRDRR